MSVSETPAKVLVVDDDPIALFICTSHLENAGFAVRCCQSVAEARETITGLGVENIRAIISDYRMPEEDGLVLLRHAQALDPALAVVIATAEGEKTLVADSLRSGAADFLEKPIAGDMLLDAVRRAVERTARARSLTRAAREVHDLGNSQRSLLGLSTALVSDRIRLVYLPHTQAGGDFVAAFPLGPERLVVLVSDVSGHDAQAAYRSAYLQGYARALLSEGASIGLSFERINRLLMEEWNLKSNEILSLAACGAMVDFAKGELQILNCGLPAPFLVDGDGWARMLDENTGSPLGWFDVLPETSLHHCAGARLVFWSDGLEDLAERLDVAPFCLVQRLQREGTCPPELATRSMDDIIVVQINLNESYAPGQRGAIPLISDIYDGDSASKIDEIQARLERSLLLALPELREMILHDVLICIRETVLNGLLHGCSGDASRKVRLLIADFPESGFLRVCVSDEGPGYDFDVGEHAENASRLLLGEHRGLILIRHLSSRLEVTNRGSRTQMDFNYQTNAQPQSL